MMVISIAEAVRMIDTPPGDYADLKKANDIAVIRRHQGAGTNPRVCDLYTKWARSQAWELFWENGKRGLL